MNNKDEKLYGSSILNVDERKITEDSSFFDDMKENYSESEISSMRKELKTTGTNKVHDKVFIDAISGIKSSKKVEGAGNEPIADIIDSKEKSGKELSKVGLDLIKNILNTDPTDEEIEAITTYFSTLIAEDDIFTVDLIVLKTILGKRITNKLIEISTKNEVSEYETITKFMVELYKSYITVVQYNDDINELYNLVTSVSNIDLDDIDPNDTDSLMKQYKILSEATEKLKNLDDRNRRLKSDYKITDFDILVLDSVKECLNSALSFKYVYDKIDNVASKKFKRDIKNIDDLKQTIGNWINDLKSDTETLYTFPVNDYLTSIESVDGMIEYIKGFIMLQDNSKAYSEFNEMPEDGEVKDVTEYFLSKGYVTKKKLENYELSAIVLLYFLSKTFKKKKIKTNDDRRVLSYTLDIISKASDISHASRLMKLINYFTEKLLNIDPYHYMD